MNESIEFRLSVLEENNKILVKKVEELQSSIISIEKGNELVNYKFDQIMNSISCLNEKFDELSNVPKGRWELIITSIISAFTTGIVGYFVLKK